MKELEIFGLSVNEELPLCMQPVAKATNYIAATELNWS
jgi:hypothetical protein